MPACTKRICKFIAALTQKLWYNMTSIVQYLAEKFTHFTAELPQLSEYQSEMSTLASRQKSWYQPRDSLATVWKFRPPHRNFIWHNSILISDILSVGHCMSTTNMWTAWKFWPQLRKLIWRNYGNKVAQLYTHILSVGHCRSVSYHFLYLLYDEECTCRSISCLLDDEDCHNLEI